MTRILGVLIALVVMRDLALADATPWAAGVSDEQQQRANALFAEANELFAHQSHEAALAKYRAAVAVWNHPMIRFNMAVSLIKLERFVEAADALDDALRYGDRPYTPSLYKQALDYRKLVDSKVGTLEASCSTPDMTIYLDGRVWFACPGARTRRVAAGEHLLVGELTTHVSTSTQLTFGGGMSRHVDVAPPARLPILRTRDAYPVPRWIPWALFGAGATIAVGGFYTRARAQQDLLRYEDELAARCPPACEDLWADQRATAQRRTTLGLSAAIGGGAIATAALVWTIVNRPHRVAVDVTPTSGGGMAHVRMAF